MRQKKKTGSLARFDLSVSYRYVTISKSSTGSVTARLLYQNKKKKEKEKIPKIPKFILLRISLSSSAALHGQSICVQINIAITLRFLPCCGAVISDEIGRC